MRSLRTPFYGTPEDRALLPESERERFVRSMGDGSDGEPPPELDAPIPIPVHPDYCEKGIELPLGFVPHKGENRTQRRSAVANFAHPEANRRELLAQRQRERRGKLDIETRRLQRKALSK